MQLIIFSFNEHLNLERFTQLITILKGEMVKTKNSQLYIYIYIAFFKEQRLFSEYLKKIIFISMSECKCGRLLMVLLIY